MTGMGRKKTQMKMNQGNDARQVVPPVQRSGLFKKFSEVTTLCALETTFFIFFPAGKAISFAHPGDEPVITNLARTGNPDRSAELPHALHYFPSFSYTHPFFDFKRL